MKRKMTLFWLLSRVRKRIPQMILMTAAHVLQALLGVCFALGTKQVIDCAVAGQPEPFFRACRQQGLIILGILLCIAVFRHLKDRLYADLERDWKKQLLHGLLHGDYAEVSAYHSAELLNRINNDVQTVNDGILTVLPNVSAMVMRLIAAVMVLAALDGRFTLVMVALGCMVISGTGLLRRKLKALHKKVKEYDGRVSGLIQETMEKLLMVQAMDVSDEVEHRTEVLLDERYEVQRRRKNMSLAAHMGVSVISYGAAFLALAWCAYHVLMGRMSIGSMTAVTQLVNQLQMPFVNLSGVFPKYVAMMASAERLMELDNIQGEQEPMLQKPAERYRTMTALTAENLGFSYNRDHVLENVDFLLPKDAFVVITGASGIGKSTLLKLLLGIFRPEKGELNMDCGGTKIPLDRSTRRMFAYVPQGNLLLSGTLRENLTIVKPDATEAELHQAIYVSAMEEFLPALPQGLDTPLGENGAGLSEGQAQRLAIARAVLGGAPILLLDECTSALDEQTEETVLRRLRTLPNRTCIAVTHRHAAIALCDLHLEVAEGSIRLKKQKAEK